jgi:hypothetical protein
VVVEEEPNVGSNGRQILFAAANFGSERSLRSTPPRPPGVELGVELGVVVVTFTP